MIKFACPHCAAALRGTEEKIGKSARCPKCGKRIVMESAGNRPLDSPAAKRIVRSPQWMSFCELGVAILCVLSLVSIAQNLDRESNSAVGARVDDIAKSSTALIARLDEMHARITDLEERLESRMTAIEERPDRFLIATWRIDQLFTQLQEFNRTSSLLEPTHLFQVIDDGKDYVRDGLYRERAGTYGPYQNGKRHGRWIQYQEPASRNKWPLTRSVGEYVNGKRSGLWVFSNFEKGEWTQEYPVVTPDGGAGVK